MYSQLRANLPTTDAALTQPQTGRSGVGRNVVFLGLTSLFTDVSAEIVSTVLPLYLLFYLRVAAIQFGAIDGLYGGISALVRIWGGSVADRGGRHKEVALAGYGVSAVSKLGLLLAGPAIMPLAASLFVDRIGKGIRTAPRDAMISMSARPDALGRAFGVHRALDTVGAIVGPLLAFAILAWIPGRFDAVFLTSFSFAIVGVAILALLVAKPKRAPDASERSNIVAAVRRLSAIPLYRRLAFASMALAVVTVSDAFIYLSLQRRLSFNPGFLPLLYVLTSLIYFALAVPMGRVSDRVGRQWVLLLGYVLLALVYVVMLAPVGGMASLAIALVLFGAYYACTDGVMAALVSSSLPVSLRSTGLAVQGTGAAVGAVVASLAFGAIWTVGGPHVAMQTFLAGVVVVGVLVAALLILVPKAVRDVRA